LFASRRRQGIRADRVTAGLAGLALVTTGSVVVGEVVRRVRRRGAGADSGEGMFDTAEHAFETAGEATRETVAIAIEGYEAAPRREAVLLNLLTGFVLTFAFVRLSTQGVRRGWGFPFGNVRVGRRHIHHFVPGILLAFGTGAAALVTQSERVETALAVPFGVGMGLTFDEAALLLDLRDVYWTREGLLSVQVSLGLAALLGGTILALRVLRRGERLVEASESAPVVELDQYRTAAG
jgi:hypothetical protein